MAKGAETLKRVFLELGGKSVFMVLDDVPEQAFPMVIAGSMVVFHAGQGCAYPTRLLVPKSKYAMPVAILEKAYAGYAETLGKFDEPPCILGPLISTRQLDRVKGSVHLGVKEGGRLLVGGKDTGRPHVR